ncbi:hypothetical protein IFM89_016978 [Coptis chinensis]|uniref:Bet v I/Major latex protein domain-containing protein n=1 Tax=Coptis chinensis TaxID=261450 RepID=A0A835HTD0_9MAGN|nr:hypothetical protein IFM89_016978 [Coptis chinensis]
MRGHVQSEYEAAASADEIWAVYSSPDLPRLIVELMPARYERIDVLKGDGTVGTVIRNFLNPGDMDFYFLTFHLGIYHTTILMHNLFMQPCFLSIVTSDNLIYILISANSGPLTWNEKFIKIDDKTRTKVVQHIEGGYLDMGFSFYENIFTIIKTGKDSCLITARTVFDVAEEYESNTSLISVSWAMARAISNYVIQNRANKDEKQTKSFLRCC